MWDANIYKAWIRNHNKDFVDVYGMSMTIDSFCDNIYDHIIFDRPDMKNKIDEFFKNHPDDIFEIWDFGYKYGYIIDMDRQFIHQDYDESKSMIFRGLKRETDVLRLTKEQYERMLR